MSHPIEEDFVALFPLFHKKLFRQKHFHGQHNRILFTIDDYDGKSMKFYCEKIDMSKSNLTKAVNSLIEMDYIKRKRDENDRRIVNLYMTKVGKIEVKNRKKQVLELIHERLSPLSEEDQKKLRNHLVGMKELLNKL